MLQAPRSFLPSLVLRIPNMMEPCAPKWRQFRARFAWSGPERPAISTPTAKNNTRFGGLRAESELDPLEPVSLRGARRAGLPLDVLHSALLPEAQWTPLV